MRFGSLFLLRFAIGLSVILVCIQFCLLLLNCGKCEENSKFPYNIRSTRSVQSLEEEVKKLKGEIANLQQELDRYHKLDEIIVAQNTRGVKTNIHTDASFLNQFLPRSEFEVIPFTSFTTQHLFGDVGFLAKKPAALPIGQKAEEMYEIFDFALNRMNSDLESKTDRVSIDNFVEGITRNDLMHGTVYDLYFRSNHLPDTFKRLKVLRPYTALQTIGHVETMDTSNEWINLILPLSGRLDKFRQFLERFVNVAVRRDRRVFLTIVYFGREGQAELKETVQQMASKESYVHYKVIFRDQDFNRGLGLQLGAESWSTGNVLMFFCDVDIYYTNDFLERCRLHAAPGSKVYYPITFSQYNPEIVYGGQTPPPLDEQMKITDDGGFWRDFGFGMTCQYRDDFFAVGGFDLSIKGWGGEDVMLYKQYLRFSVTTVRAYDRSLMHIYHTKSCRKTLSDAQFISCLQSKAASEGSHKQLGMLAFGSSLVNGKDPDWSHRLQSSLSDIPDR